MASFVVMERRGIGGGRDVEFVRDGFHILAFLVPLFWFLFHRMWIEAAVTLALIVAFAILTSLAGYPAHWPLSLIVSIFAGLEAPALRLASMRRAGWRDAGVIEAEDAFGAEERYVAEWGADEPSEPEPVETEATAQAETPHAPRPASGPALGLFSYPDGR
jgi:hypothetical protein